MISPFRRHETMPSFSKIGVVLKGLLKLYKMNKINLIRDQRRRDVKLNRGYNMQGVGKVGESL